MSLFDVAILSSRHNFAIQAGAAVSSRRAHIVGIAATLHYLRGRAYNQSQPWQQIQMAHDLVAKHRLFV
jgi:hypothetical protein